MLDTTEMVCVEDKEVQCEAVTRSMFEEMVREICDMMEVETYVLQVFSPLCEPSPRKIPTQTPSDLSRQWIDHDPTQFC